MWLDEDDREDGEEPNDPSKQFELEILDRVTDVYQELLEQHLGDRNFSPPEKMDGIIGGTLVAMIMTVFAHLSEQDRVDEKRAAIIDCIRDALPEAARRAAEIVDNYQREKREERDGDSR